MSWVTHVPLMTCRVLFKTVLSTYTLELISTSPLSSIPPFLCFSFSVPLSLILIHYLPILLSFFSLLQLILPSIISSLPVNIWIALTHLLNKICYVDTNISKISIHHFYILGCRENINLVSLKMYKVSHVTFFGCLTYFNNRKNKFFVSSKSILKRGTVSPHPGHTKCLELYTRICITYHVLCYWVINSPLVLPRCSGVRHF